MMERNVYNYFAGIYTSHQNITFTPPCFGACFYFHLQARDEKTKAYSAGHLSY
jgi:hypothetical protein